MDDIESLKRECMNLQREIRGLEAGGAKLSEKLDKVEGDKKALIQMRNNLRRIRDKLANSTGKP